jgi:hypothetical protein
MKKSTGATVGTVVAGIVIAKAVTSPRFGRILLWVVLLFLVAMAMGSRS